MLRILLAIAKSIHPRILLLSLLLTILILVLARTHTSALLLLLLPLIELCLQVVKAVDYYENAENYRRN